MYSDEVGKIYTLDDLGKNVKLHLNESLVIIVADLKKTIVYENFLTNLIC